MTLAIENSIDEARAVFIVCVRRGATSCMENDLPGSRQGEFLPGKAVSSKSRRFDA